MTISGVTVNAPMHPGLKRLFGLADTAASALMRIGFTPTVLDRLAAGTDATGRRLPSSAHVAAVRLGLSPVHRKGTYVPSRVDRMVQANVVATLRTLTDRDTALQRLVGTGELASTHPLLRASLAKNLNRQVDRHLKHYPGADIGALRLPMLQHAPTPGSRLVLAAVDSHFASMEPDPEAAALVLSLRLPANTRPASRKAWVVTEIILPIPRHLRGRPISRWHLPTITPHPTRPGIARFHLAYTEPDVPVREPGTPVTSVIGVDWSPTTLGVASHTHTGEDGHLKSAYEGHRYDDRGLGIKLARLQAEGQVLTGKIDRTWRLADGLPEGSTARTKLEAKIALWKELRIQLGAKRSRINRELAFHFAAWITGYALAIGATTIAVEDLSTLEAGGIGRANNNQVSQSARHKTVQAITHLGTRTGLEVIEVPARGTSAHCPGCDAELTRPGGYHHARCRPCGLDGNRDQVASVNIGKRAIAGQKQLKTDRRTGRKLVKTAVHDPVKRVRRAKDAPTPRRTRHKRVRRSIAATATPAAQTTNRNFPASPASVWDSGQPSGTRASRTTTPCAPGAGTCQRSADAHPRRPGEHA